MRLSYAPPRSSRARPAPRRPSHCPRQANREPVTNLVTLALLETRTSRGSRSVHRPRLGIRSNRRSTLARYECELRSPTRSLGRGRRGTATRQHWRWRTKYLNVGPRSMSQMLLQIQEHRLPRRDDFAAPIPSANERPSTLTPATGLPTA